MAPREVQDRMAQFKYLAEYLRNLVTDQVAFTATARTGHQTWEFKMGNSDVNISNTSRGFTLKMELARDNGAPESLTQILKFIAILVKPEICSIKNYQIIGPNFVVYSIDDSINCVKLEVSSFPEAAQLLRSELWQDVVEKWLRRYPYERPNRQGPLHHLKKNGLGVPPTFGTTSSPEPEPPPEPPPLTAPRDNNPLFKDFLDNILRS